MSGLPATIKIDDITSGRIDPNDIYKELERLKVEINVLRHDMTMFVRALATIPQGQSQSEYFNSIESRLKTVRAGISEYYEQYARLLPVINLAQIKLGHEVELVSSKQTTSGTKAEPVMKVEPRRVSTSKEKGTANQPIELL
ncbi:hypothetical protein CAAN1_02S05864 [[Candida] anglica]|uniref:Mediator of RNA polymerase II transcription subunit 11 n=1 Tax=[Candida] anglica TaxID=148631 RepID=A0ABP0EGK5_9ASCO